MNAMTPPLVLSPIAPGGNPAGPHLSEDQFGDLLASPGAGAESNPHLLGCEQCAAELAAIRQSLGLFRDASRAHADTELRRLPQMTLPSRRLVSPAMQPGWWLAAAATLLTAVLPMQVQRMRGHHSVTATSSGVSATISAPSDDEALLEDVDRESSASLPAPMQALANPSTDFDRSTPLASQRKD